MVLEGTARTGADALEHIEPLRTMAGGEAGPNRDAGITAMGDIDAAPRPSAVGFALWLPHRAIRQRERIRNQA